MADPLSKHILSKSTFMYGCQCPKRLYLHKFKRELRNPDDELQQFVFDSGTSVGELARDLFPNGVDVTPPNPYSYHISIAKTKILVEQGARIIYEAAFQCEGVMCALDILVRHGNAWYAFEVKNSTSVKDQHLQDAALQYWVVNNSGLALEDISIIHLNNQYVRKGELNIQSLFTTQSILEEVERQQEFITSKVQELKILLVTKTEPVIDIGPHCSSPYGCDFTALCWAHMPKENSILDLVRGPGWKLYEEGYRHFDDIPEGYEMGSTATMQLAHYRSGEVHIEKDQIKSFLTPLAYPLYFFDFETIMPGIPEFDDSRPYQQIPFQFSLHVQQRGDSSLQHFEFLGDGINDPRLPLVEAMIAHMGNTGSVLCYNMSFEKSLISELMELYPQYESALGAIKERIVDLMVPFQKRWYYHPAFQGSYSIKYVLPALIPELSYKDLEIQEGAAASLVYGQLKTQKKETVKIQREQLLAYCKLDTLAMVRILDHLRNT
jgi:hypothetical protein